MKNLKKIPERTLLITVFSSLILFIISMILYPETYLFFRYYLSDLGRASTINGYENSLSSSIFIAVMLINATTMFFLAYEINDNSKKKTKKTFIYILKINVVMSAGIGFICIAFPSDTFMVVHIFGVAITFMSILIMLNIYLIEFLKQREDFIVYIFLFLANSIILIYVIIQVQTPVAEFAPVLQKVTVFLMFIEVLYIVLRKSTKTK